MGYGFQPNNDILRSLGCKHEFDESRGHLVTRRNDNCETTVSRIYAVGDCCGLGGAPAALEEGLIAAAAAAEALGLTLSASLAATRRDARRRLKRHRRFQAALWRMFNAPRYQTELAGQTTLICRCENVDLESLEAALSDGEPSIGEIKRRTRLGMGPCQGRYCAPVVAAMLAERRGRPIDEMAYFAPRAPVKPIRIADMVKAGGE
jgi:NAD(P)H-nitrite reductase large subunit